MPAFDFHCPSCGTRFEKRLGFKDNPDLVRCPRCNAQVQRIFSPPAIIFKGSGFYVTDNRAASKSSTSSKH